MKRMKWVGFLVGFGLLGWVLRSADLRAVWQQVTSLHWRFLVIVLFYAVIFGLDTLGWQFALTPASQARVRWDRLFRVRLAGEAINYVTPTAWVGGEPVKAYLLSQRYGVPMADGMASVVIAKTTFSFSMLLFILGGLLVTAVARPIPPSLARWAWITLPALAILLLLFLATQFLRPFGRGASMVRRIAPGWLRSLGAKLHEWDRAIVALYRQAPQRIFWSLGFHLLGWLAGVV